MLMTTIKDTNIFVDYAKVEYIKKKVFELKPNKYWDLLFLENIEVKHYHECGKWILLFHLNYMDENKKFIHKTIETYYYDRNGDVFVFWNYGSNETWLCNLENINNIYMKVYERISNFVIDTYNNGLEPYKLDKNDNYLQFCKEEKLITIDQFLELDKMLSDIRKQYEKDLFIIEELFA